MVPSGAEFRRPIFDFRLEPRSINSVALSKAAKWKSLEDLRKTFPATDMVGDLAIFNIRGNQYRLIVRMVWRYQRMYVKEFLTHAEYDKGRWKRWLV